MFDNASVQCWIVRATCPLGRTFGFSLTILAWADERVPLGLKGAAISMWKTTVLMRGGSGMLHTYDLGALRSCLHNNGGTPAHVPNLQNIPEITIDELRKYDPTPD